MAGSRKNCCRPVQNCGQTQANTGAVAQAQLLTHAGSAGSPANPSESVGGGEAADGFSGSARAAATAAAAPPGGEAATTLSNASRVARMRRAVSVVALLPAAGAAACPSAAGSAGLMLRSCCCAAPNRDRPAPLTKGVRPARHARRSALTGTAAAASPPIPATGSDL